VDGKGGRIHEAAVSSIATTDVSKEDGFLDPRPGERAGMR
jgi:hypothetical protein